MTDQASLHNNSGGFALVNLLDLLDCRKLAARYSEKRSYTCHIACLKSLTALDASSPGRWELSAILCQQAAPASA